MKRYLVTGAAGFIGTNFVKYMLEKYSDIEIIVIDKLTYAGNKGNIQKEIDDHKITFVRGDICNSELIEDIFTRYDIDYVVNFAAESHVDRSIANPRVFLETNFVRGDICNSELIEDIFTRYDIDYVVNFAAESHVDRSIANPRVFLETNILGTQNLLDSIANPRVFLETNILGTQNLLDIAKKFWTIGYDEKGYPIYKEGKKYIQISTDEVYGSLTREYIDSQELILDEKVRKIVEGRKKLKTYGDKFFTETTPLDPRSPYSASKASADMIVMAYHETYKLFMDR